MQCFCIDIDATKAAVLLKMNRKTINRYYKTFRRLIFFISTRRKAENSGHGKTG